MGAGVLEAVQVAVNIEQDEPLAADFDPSCLTGREFVSFGDFEKISHSLIPSNLRPTTRSHLCIARESETTYVAALRHALVKLEAAAARGGQQREIEVTDLRVFHREFVEDAVVCLDR